MNNRRHTKIVREGQYIAEVEVELIDTDEGWSPYLSLETHISWTMSGRHCGAAMSRPPDD